MQNIAISLICNLTAPPPPHTHTRNDSIYISYFPPFPNLCSFSKEIQCLIAIFLYLFAATLSSPPLPFVLLICYFSLSFMSRFLFLGKQLDKFLQTERKRRRKENRRREGERTSERNRDIETEKQGQRDGQKEREIESEAERQRDRERENERERERERE